MAGKTLMGGPTGIVGPDGQPRMSSSARKDVEIAELKAALRYLNEAQQQLLLILGAIVHREGGISITEAEISRLAKSNSTLDVKIDPVTGEARITVAAPTTPPIE